MSVFYSQNLLFQPCFFIPWHAWEWKSLSWKSLTFILRKNYYFVYYHWCLSAHKNSARNLILRIELQCFWMVTDSSPPMAGSCFSYFSLKSSSPHNTCCGVVVTLLSNNIRGDVVTIHYWNPSLSTYQLQLCMLAEKSNSAGHCRCPYRSLRHPPGPDCHRYGFESRSRVRRRSRHRRSRLTKVTSYHR